MLGLHRLQQHPLARPVGQLPAQCRPQHLVLGTMMAAHGSLERPPTARRPQDPPRIIIDPDGDPGDVFQFLAHSTVRGMHRGQVQGHAPTVPSNHGLINDDFGGSAITRGL
jgi:hypothetical protein